MARRASGSLTHAGWQRVTARRWARSHRTFSTGSPCVSTADWLPSPGERLADIRRWALGNPVVDKRELSNEAVSRLRSAMLRRPGILPGTLDRVLEILASREGVSSRRAIALTRLAVACARLNGDTSVGQQHVDTAALMLDLPIPTASSEPCSPRAGSARPEPTADEQPLDVPDGPISFLNDSLSEGLTIGDDRDGQTAVLAEVPEPLPQVDLPEELAGPYPEDHAARGAQRDCTPRNSAGFGRRQCRADQSSGCNEHVPLTTWLFSIRF